MMFSGQAATHAPQPVQEFSMPGPSAHGNRFGIPAHSANWDFEDRNNNCRRENVLPERFDMILTRGRSGQNLIHPNAETIPPYQQYRQPRN